MLMGMDAAEHDSQIFGSWGEVMSDPDLDLSRPWFVTPDPDPTVTPAPSVGWPTKWVDMGATEDGG
jgi:hypothetical protein